MHRAALFLAAAGFCLAAGGASPEQVLARVRERVTSDLQRIPNYTCAQTVTRRYFKPDVELPANSCGAKYTPQSWSVDRLRLEVAVTPAREVYSWAGARQFDARDLTEIVGGGPIGTGAFSAFLNAIFGDSGAEFSYANESLMDGRRMIEFDYRIRPEKSRYQIRAGSGWVVAGYEGRFLVDAETGTLQRLSVRADGLPESTGSCRTETEIVYGDFLLPSATRQRFVLRTGMESENTTTYSACREFRSESTVRFLDPGPESAADQFATFNAIKSGTLPPGLPVTMGLASPLDTWKASAGDVIALRLAKPIKDSAKRVLVPAGAAIQARLLRVQRYFTSPERVTVVMRPEIGNIPVAQFDFVGDHVILPKGYHTTWHTE
jgi:hypothetical protein